MSNIQFTSTRLVLLEFGHNFDLIFFYFELMFFLLQGRYYLSAETLVNVKSWVAKIRSSLKISNPEMERNFVSLHCTCIAKMSYFIYYRKMKNLYRRHLHIQKNVSQNHYMPPSRRGPSTDPTACPPCPAFTGTRETCPG